MAVLQTVSLTGRRTEFETDYPDRNREALHAGPYGPHACGCRVYFDFYACSVSIRGWRLLSL